MEGTWDEDESEKSDEGYDLEESLDGGDSSESYSDLSLWVMESSEIFFEERLT